MNNSGPAIMMMPPNIRTIFLPPPPLRPLAIPFKKKKHRGTVSGVSHLMAQFERTRPPVRKIGPTPKQAVADKRRRREEEHKAKLAGPVSKYRDEQARSSGKFGDMNCYNTLFVGRLKYEVTERKLLREFETFGQVKDLTLMTDKDKKSRGYAFVEFEEEDDMKRAYREADRMRIDGRAVVVDVERGHTVPGWLPRKYGGGLGGTRIGGKARNVTIPGRWKPEMAKMGGIGPGGPGDGMGMVSQPKGGRRGNHFSAGPPPMGHGDFHRGGLSPGPPHMHGGYPPEFDRYGGPPRCGGGPNYDRHGGGGHDGFRGGGYGGGRGGYRDEGRGGGYGDRFGGPPKRHRSRSRSPSPRDRRSRYY